MQILKLESSVLKIEMILPTFRAQFEVLGVKR